MSRVTIRLKQLIILAVVPLLTVCKQPGTVDVTIFHALLYGKIVDSSNVPLEGVAVVIAKSSNSCALATVPYDSTRSDGAGNYRLVVSTLEAVGCVKVVFRMAGELTSIDSVFIHDLKFRSAEPYDSIRIDVTLNRDTP